MGGVPKWLMEQAEHKRRLEASRGAPLPCVVEVEKHELDQLKYEHERFREALEIIAQGGDRAIALEALGRLMTYEQMEARIQELEGEVEMLTNALEAATDG